MSLSSFSLEQANLSPAAAANMFWSSGFMEEDMYAHRLNATQLLVSQGSKQAHMPRLSLNSLLICGP